MGVISISEQSIFERTHPWYQDSAPVQGVSEVEVIGVQHHRDCPHYIEGYGYNGRDLQRQTLSPECVQTSIYTQSVLGENGRLVVEELEGPGCDLLLRVTRWKDAILCDRERNYYHDSDFYVIYWDEETQSLRYYEYNTTRFAGGGSAQVDASDEVRQKARDWLYSWILQALLEDDKRQSVTPAKGKRVRAFKGRKVPIGTEGEVVWYGNGNYRRMRVGIREDGDPETAPVHWTDASNVEVINPEQYVRSYYKRRKAASAYADRVLATNHGWHIPFLPANMPSF